MSQRTYDLFVQWNWKKTTIILILGLFTYLYYLFFITTSMNNQIYLKSASVTTVQPIKRDLKYILQWTSTEWGPFDDKQLGRTVFVKNNCEHSNCFVTKDRNYLPDVKDFDAVAFNAKEVAFMKPSSFPQRRSPTQKYIFTSMESSHYYPACDPKLNQFFNWTWTYKLDSDFRWGYFTVYDFNGTVVGPAIDISWPKVMKPIDEELANKLSTKTKAVAWFVSNCKPRSGRMVLAAKIEAALSKYNRKLFTYGTCGKYTCKRFKSECDKILQEDFYFYLAFENSYAEDYVTEKVLTALNNYAVPVIYGAASYSRFLPPGSFLNATGNVNATEIARSIDEIIRNPKLYHDFHRWRNHFKFADTDDNTSFCKICAALNNRTVMEEVTVKKNLREWWNGAYGQCRNGLRV